MICSNFKFLFPGPAVVDTVLKTGQIFGRYAALYGSTAAASVFSKKLKMKVSVNSAQSMMRAYREGVRAKRRVDDDDELSSLPVKKRDRRVLLGESLEGGESGEGGKPDVLGEGGESGEGGKPDVLGEGGESGEDGKPDVLGEGGESGEDGKPSEVRKEGQGGRGCGDSKCRYCCSSCHHTNPRSHTTCRIWWPY